jgi:hypothetical protein
MPAKPSLAKEAAEQRDADHTARLTPAIAIAGWRCEVAGVS